MLNTILQTDPANFMELLELDPTKTVVVIVLWGVAFMYGWWAIAGKEAVPRQLMAFTFIIITVATFVLTFYLFPEIYSLARGNPVEFLVAFLGSGVFGIILLPMMLMMAFGALTGYIRR